MTAQERVDMWKAEQLTALEFSTDEISVLLFWGTSMHDVWDLMGSPRERTTCTPEQAMRILAPLDVLDAALTPA